MVEYSPAWDAIAQDFGISLKQAGGMVQVYDRFPDNPISKKDLPCAVIVEPTFTPTSFTFGTVSVAYTGTLDICVRAVSTGQPEISKADANQCRALGLTLQIWFHKNRSFATGDRTAKVILGEAKIIRLSPVAGGDYAGLEIPYTVTIQYASN